MIMENNAPSLKHDEATARGSDRLEKSSVGSKEVSKSGIININTEILDARILQLRDCMIDPQMFKTVSAMKGQFDEAYEKAALDCTIKLKSNDSNDTQMLK